MWIYFRCPQRSLKRKQQSVCVCRNGRQSTPTSDLHHHSCQTYYCQSQQSFYLTQTILWLLWYSLDGCAIKSPCSPLERNKEASIDCMLGLAVLFFDASKQYTCPWSPFAKYISHIPVAPFNTEKCRDLYYLFSQQLGGRYTMIPWELPGIWWWWWRCVGGGWHNACIVSFL